jgi:two-component sensor histidine kinase/CheY-like chemotaxis protein/integral membrane sensor domain MASE1
MDVRAAASSPAGRWLLLSLQFAAAYAIAGVPAALWAERTMFMSPAWLGAGVAIYLIWRWGLYALPGLALGAVTLRYVISDEPLPGHLVGVLILLASLLPSALLLRRLVPAGQKLRLTLKLILSLQAAVGLAAITVATFMVLREGVYPSPVPSRAGGSWIGWFSGALAGMIIIMPLLVSRHLQTLKSAAASAAASRTAFCLLLTVLVSWLVFAGTSDVLRDYHIFPVLALAALILPLQGVAICLVGCAATFFVTFMFGPAATPRLLGDSSALYAFQHFLVISAATSLFLCAAVTEARAEDVLRALQERLHWTLMASGIVAWEADPDTRKLNVLGNPMQLLGTSDLAAPDELLDRVHPQDRGRLQTLMQAAQSSGSAVVEHRLLRADGSERWIRTHAHVVVDENRRRRLSGISIDIDEQRKAALELASTAERLRLAQEATGIGSWEMVWPDGEVIWSPEMYRLFDRDPALGPATATDYLRIVHPEDQAQAISMELLDAEGEVREVEFRLILADGSVRWISRRTRSRREPGSNTIRLFGTAMDITSRKEDDERQALLMGELDHRVKNMLATIKAVIARTATHGRSAAELSQLLGGRIEAMARTHSLLASNRWHSASFHKLLEDELAPYGSDRCTIRGDDVSLMPRAAMSLSLVFHELATNAAKYGALSSELGILDISSRSAPGAARLDVVWRERSPTIPADPPTTKGFGTSLTERVIRGEFAGRLETEFRAGELVRRISLPLARIGRAPVLGPHPQGAAGIENEAPADATPLSGLNVLLVEDATIVAAEVQAVLTEAGALVIGPLATLEEALRVTRELDRIDVGVLDVNLEGASISSLCALFEERGVPFLLATGYSDDRAIEPALRDKPRLLKPFGGPQLVSMVTRVVADGRRAPAAATLASAG